MGLPPSETPGAQSGLLTAGTWDDNLNFMFFRDYLKTRSGVIAPLEINREDALNVEVKDAAGKALPGATVKLLAAGQSVFETVTRGEGRTLLFPSWDGAPAGAALSVEASLGTKTASHAVSAVDYMKADKKVTLTLAETTAQAPASLDLAFLIDTTGSMGDELSYLKAEVDGIAKRVAAAYPQVALRFALVAYKDKGDSYETREFDFDSLAALETNLEAEYAGGGGDWPEAVHSGLDKLTKLSWQADARVAFWIADAEYHSGKQQLVEGHLKTARGLGVHIYPIASSGINDSAEAMMRDAAQVTGGRYLFLTDDSGIGEAHQEPHIPCYYITRLDQAMERMLRIELAGVYEEPAAAQIIRTGGTLSTGQCTLQSGAVVTAY
jgi:hypothetical protein